MTSISKNLISNSWYTDNKQPDTKFLMLTNTHLFRKFRGWNDDCTSGVVENGKAFLFGFDLLRGLNIKGF